MKNNFCCHPELASGSCHISNKGFTLLEVLVVVIIIAVLAAIAVPMYKHAVLKSRFSAVMPMAKAIADAQEVYYQGRQMYALSTDELDVAPAADGTSIALAPETQEDQYNYVAASSAEVPGARYIIYQQYSPKFASTIQCEADVNNEQALWLCEKGLGGTEIPGGSVNTTGGTYKTFLLGGSIGDDTFGEGEQTERIFAERSVIQTECDSSRCKYFYDTGDTLFLWVDKGHCENREYCSTATQRSVDWEGGNSNPIDVYYDNTGNIVSMNFEYGGYNIWFDKDGNFLSSSVRNSNAEQHSYEEEFSRANTLAPKIAAKKTKCQLYPELQECPH